MFKIALLTFLVLSLFSGSNVQAQACGQHFGLFWVSDSKGNSVSNATVELLTSPSREKYEELWEKYGNKEPGFQPNPFKIPLSVAKDLIKLNAPLSITEDFCGNPLKQTAGKTKVKTLTDREASEKNFGFCTVEGGNGSHYLLKISAPRYVTNYYLGDYLGGCHGWSFVLTDNKKTKK